MAFSCGTRSWTHCPFCGFPSEPHDPHQAQETSDKPTSQDTHKINGWPSQKCHGPERPRGWPRWRKTKDPRPREKLQRTSSERRHLSELWPRCRMASRTMCWPEGHSHPGPAEGFRDQSAQGVSQIAQGEMCVCKYERENESNANGAKS